MPVRLTQLLRAALLGAPLALVGLAPAPAEAAPARPTLAQATAPAPMLQEAQYYGGPPRRGRRCWMEERRVRFRDAYGRVHVRIRPVRVCR
jgi:hypothetical protein